MLSSWKLMLWNQAWVWILTLSPHCRAICGNTLSLASCVQRSSSVYLQRRITMRTDLELLDNVVRRLDMHLASLGLYKRCVFSIRREKKEIQTGVHRFTCAFEEGNAIIRYRIQGHMLVLALGVLSCPLPEVMTLHLSVRFARGPLLWAILMLETG